jgi:hypothetical protein
VGAHRLGTGLTCVAEHRKSLRIDAGLAGEVAKRCAEIFPLCRRALVTARLTTALTAVVGVEHERRVAKLGQPFGVLGRRLLLLEGHEPEDRHRRRRARSESRRKQAPDDRLPLVVALRGRQADGRLNVGAPDGQKAGPYLARCRNRPDRRGRSVKEQLRRFMGSGARRKLNAPSRAALVERMRQVASSASVGCY